MGIDVVALRKEIARARYGASRQVELTLEDATTLVDLAETAKKQGALIARQRELLYDGFAQAALNAMITKSAAMTQDEKRLMAEAAYDYADAIMYERDRRFCPQPLPLDHSIPTVTAPEPDQALVKAMALLIGELDGCYSRDRVAHENAQQIERIFDRLNELTGYAPAATVPSSSS